MYFGPFVSLCFGRCLVNAMTARAHEELTAALTSLSLPPSLAQTPLCFRQVLLHIRTEKGMGYPPAMAASDKYHGVAKFNVATGKQHKGVSQLHSTLHFTAARPYRFPRVCFEFMATLLAARLFFFASGVECLSSWLGDKASTFFGSCRGCWPF